MTESWRPRIDPGAFSEALALAVRPDPGPVRCLHCLDTGHACESHPEYPWADLYGVVEGHANCGAAAMPCGFCCSPIPEDGSTSIVEAFIPDWRREELRRDIIPWRWPPRLGRLG